MLTALIIALLVAALILAAAVATVITGWFPRLAALTVRAVDTTLPGGQSPGLNHRDRSEIIARLWISRLV